MSIAWASDAAAQAPSEAPVFDVDYATHDATAAGATTGPGPSETSCPDRLAFIAAIRARTPRARLAETPDELKTAVHFRVTIDVRKTSAVGALDVRDPRDESGAAQTRSVTGRTCREAAKGIALVAALILDPDASTAAETDLPPAPPSEPQPPPPPSAVVLPPPPPTPPLTPTTKPEPARTRWRLSAGAELGIVGGIGPGVAPVGGAFADLALATPRLFSPSLRVGVDIAATSSELPGGAQRDRGDQSYLWFAGSIRACPIHLGVGFPNVRIGPCAGLQIGLHHGSTSGVPNATTNGDLWLAASALAAVEWAVTPRWTLEIDGGATFPVRRSRFFLFPNTIIYDVPVAAGTLLVSGRLRFL